MEVSAFFNRDLHKFNVCLISCNNNNNNIGQSLSYFIAIILIVIVTVIDCSLREL